METEKKKILFITSTDTIGWAFDDEIELLGNDYECHKVSSLIEAQKIVQSGIDKVVIYPFYIARYDDIDLGDRHPRIFAGYCFWEQKLADKKIPTIVVDLHVQPSTFLEEIIKIGWKKSPNVFFFSHDNTWENKEKLVELIKS